ncbi:GDSL-type esterase/lipase family protein [Dyadobacter sp. CY343]|uniref:GDSL-type esterase/lipase family protein n=1 Tax=Dyadobacter sp. CY343 TaxID=2907299 RepID=UPI001F1C5FCA|nr:GDSL-type esterase/lipase family protein [Dyadobacter sp. CY343]MCE7063193.1 GDSL-type esterase/lipase family protein [Dyadobacter sp. CY343]
MIGKCAFRHTGIIVQLTLLLIGGNAFGQTVSWDSTTRPEIYPPRVALMKTFHHSKKDIVFLGNSITFWAEWQELLGNKRIRNRGIPGDTSYGILDRLDEVTGGKPAKVFLMIGINDLAKNTPGHVLTNNYKRIVRRIKTKSPKTRIYLQTMLPTNDSFKKLPNHCNKDELIREVNSGLAILAKEENAVFIDLYSHFVNHEGKLKKELTWDGVHLTAEGYQLWAEILKKGKFLK